MSELPQGGRQSFSLLVGKAVEPSVCLGRNHKIQTTGKRAGWQRAVVATEGIQAAVT